jgi:hypothetical protein
MRGLLGKRFHFRGGSWMLIEVLADEASIVLRGSPAENRIQLDQFGRPLRRVGPLASIPILSTDGERLSPELLELLSAPITR